MRFSCKLCSMAYRHEKSHRTRGRQATRTYNNVRRLGASLSASATTCASSSSRSFSLSLRHAGSDQDVVSHCLHSFVKRRTLDPSPSCCSSSLLVVLLQALRSCCRLLGPSAPIHSSSMPPSPPPPLLSSPSPSLVLLLLQAILQQQQSYVSLLSPGSSLSRATSFSSTSLLPTARPVSLGH